MATTTLEQNKVNVQAFYDLIFNERQPAEALQRYAGARSISSTTPTSATAGQHNVEPLVAVRNGHRAGTCAGCRTPAGSG